MSCKCTDINSVNSWNDFNYVDPQDPRDLISLAVLNVGGSVTGTWALSSNYARPLPPSPWIASPISITGEALVSANGSDSLQNVSDADQWNFAHQTTNNTSSIAIPLRKIIFLRAGVGWLNTIPISLGAGTFTDLQLSFLENAATRGDAQGTVPVIRWNLPLTGSGSLGMILKRPGRFSLGLLGIDSSGVPNYSMFELDVIVVS